MTISSQKSGKRGHPDSVTRRDQQAQQSGRRDRPRVRARVLEEEAPGRAKSEKGTSILSTF